MYVYMYIKGVEKKAKHLFLSEAWLLSDQNEIDVMMSSGCWTTC